MARRRYRCSWDDIAWLDANYMAGWGAFDGGGVKQLTSMTMVCRSLPSRWKMTGMPSRYSISGSKPAKRTTATQSDRGYFSTGDPAVSGDAVHSSSALRVAGAPFA